MTNADDAKARRQRLRIGALLFRLEYYMRAPEDIAAGIYRLTADCYVRVEGDGATFVSNGVEETVTLDEAIAQCKDMISRRSVEDSHGVT